MNRFSLLAVLFLALAGCSNPSYNTEAYDAPLDKMSAAVANGGMQEMEIALGEPEDGAPASEAPAHARRVIKEGQLSFESQSLPDTRQRIDSILQRMGGHVDSEREYSTSGRVSQALTVRVPVGRFDEFVDELGKGVKSFDDKSINSRDVTAEYIDVVARAKTKKELEQRYLALLRQANSVEEILSIEKELGNIRADIESMEGRIRYLADQTDYSTLHITYYTVVPERTAFGNKFSQGFVNGWNNLIWFFVGLVNIWPFVVLIPLTLFVAGRWLAKRRNKRRDANP